MALKALLLKKQIDSKKKELEALRKNGEDLEKREAELAAAIDEVTDEEQGAQVEEMISAFEADKTAHEESVKELERSIAELEGDLAAEEAAQNTEPAGNDEPGEAHERKDENIMNDHREARSLVYGDMTRSEINEMVTRDDVKEFLANVRSVMKGDTRAINGVGAVIPVVMLGLLRQNVLNYSKLYGRVTVSRVSGEGRIAIMGDIPEAVWTECCANLNELDLSIYQDTFGCWKLGGFYPICNANLEDADIDLAAEILSALGQAIGYTDDKTVIYGTGSNMPLGIVPRLAQTSQPADYPATARPWVDLHSSNVVTIANTYTGLALFQQLALAAGKAKGAYARGEKTWVMNENTYSKIVANAMSIDASGAIASGVNGTMPVIGGAIEVLPESIIPDDNIVMGFFDLYRMVERAGEKFASSEHFRFLSDQTVFKGTVRWDGKPVIAEAFVLIGIDGTAPTTSATFAADTANTPKTVWLPATATVAVGETITLKPVLEPYGTKTTFTWASGTAAKATVADGVVTGVATGTSVITVTTAEGLSAQCTVTVSA